MNMGGTCGVRKKVIDCTISQKPYAFVMLPYAPEFNVVETTFKRTVEGGKHFEDNYVPKQLEGRPVHAISARMDHFTGQGYCEICRLCWHADFGIAELAAVNVNVMLEIGLMWGFGKTIIFTLDTSRTKKEDIPFDLRNYMYVPYNDIQRLGPNLDNKIEFLLKTL
jgi:hypothetical protein